MTSSSSSSDQRLAGVLSEFARTMVTDFPIQAILDHLVERIVDVLPVSAAGVTLISPDRDPRYIAASDDSALQYEKLQTELGEGPCLLAYQSGEAVSVPDVQVEKRFPKFVPRALSAGLAAVFTFPLRHGNRQLGALDLYRNVPGALSDQSMTSAQTLADVAAAYLLNAQARQELQDSSDRSRHASLHDALTGLPNRTLLLERIEHALLRQRRTGQPAAIFFADLDQFKTVNDNYGHGTGDALLVAVARRLTALLRPHDTLARLSGDEFVVFCEDLATPAQAEAIGARVSAALSRPYLVSGHRVTASASIGTVFADNDGRAPEQLLHDADMAMYRTKFTSQNLLAVPGSLHSADRLAGLESELQAALVDDDLQVEYQPIVRVADGRLVGYEALPCWTHPTRGLISATTLSRLAEQSGLIAEVGTWALTKALTDQSRWPAANQPVSAGLSFRVSARQLMSANFTRDVQTVLGATGSPPGGLTLEVNDGVFVSDRERALLVLRDLKELGVRLALANFGTGYSSLNQLEQFPVDVVKIDQSFVAGLGRVRASHIIVDAIVKLAHGIGVTVVAEAVQTAEQHRHIAELGCDCGQGTYYCEPLDAIEVGILLTQDRRSGNIRRWPTVRSLPPAS